ncbi:iron chaperone [Spirosoma sp. KUDC1026]|uniref:iron chaperone n=1 Tax=Spirosoma sp. KUDC1026 TaxID=2745947 RepID=UPI00159BD680|nr:DUF1801 domain-containing protein [Spirosoma sp. KUDC1026]QKZ13781.1 DUF1801 domain-containing protein [Spirosoma sp. KUDC1026]
MNKETKTVDDYIASFSQEVRERLQRIRQLIKDNAPQAKESIAYGIAAYKINKKPLVYFGGFNNHISFHATPVGHEQFKDKLSVYKQGKGSVQFPHSEPLPVELIVKIIKFRVAENA